MGNNTASRRTGYGASRTAKRIMWAIHPSAPDIRIRCAEEDSRGIHTFYVGSLSQPGVEYAVKHIRRYRTHRWFCTCPDFAHRRFAIRRHCKHARALAVLAHELHGISRLFHTTQNAQVSDTPYSAE